MVRPSYWPENGRPEYSNMFDWIERGQLAMSWWPDPPVIERYQLEGIRVIINASEFDNRENIRKRFFYYHFPVPDYGLVTEEQIRKFLEVAKLHFDFKDPMVIHCVSGCGRSGQFALAWVLYFNKVPEHENPISWIRTKRQCILESTEQEKNGEKIIQLVKDIKQKEKEQEKNAVV
jgi:protein-tyrosine phosphatase